MGQLALIQAEVIEQAAVYGLAHRSSALRYNGLDREGVRLVRNDDLDAPGAPGARRQGAERSDR